MHATLLLLTAAAIITAPGSTPAPLRGAGPALPASDTVPSAPLPVPPPPPTPRVEVVDRYAGVPVPDPYRWLEDTGTEEVRAWFTAQDAYARAMLAAMPGRSHWKAQAASLSAGGAPFTTNVRAAAGDRVFYTKRVRGANRAMLFLRDGTGPERLLLDPATLGSADAPAAILSVQPSPDGALLAVQHAFGGRDHGVVRVLEAATGRLLPDPALPAVEVQWLPGSRAFLYSTHREIAFGASSLQALAGMPVRRHVLGTDPSTDAVVFDPAAPGGAPVGDTVTGSREAYVKSFAGLQVDGAGGRVVVSRHTPDAVHTGELFVAELDALDRDGVAAWRRVSTPRDSVAMGFARGAWLYAVSFRGTFGGRLVRVPLASGAAAPDWEGAQVVVPESARDFWGQEARSPGIVRAADGIYQFRSVAGRHRLFRYAYDPATPPLEIPLPFEGSFGALRGLPEHSGVVGFYGGWVEADRWYRYDPSRDAGLVPLGPAFDPPGGLDRLEGLVAETVLVPSHDGVEVPATLLRLAATPRDGRRPTVIEGYGAFGHTDDPVFRADLVPWLRAGGMWVVAHVRGGGYFGPDWHEAGRMAGKPNTWKDAIAVAEWLARSGWTSPAHLGITGRSAGGIFAGRAITERPDLFRAAVIGVGQADMLRFDLGGSGAANVDEFGALLEPASADPATFAARLAMSSYHHVRPGVSYPAVLLTMGWNDTRTPPWSPAKLAAALQHAGALAKSPRPVLLRVDFDAGHFGASTPAGQEDEYADRFAFWAAQLGMTPPPSQRD